MKSQSLLKRPFFIAFTIVLIFLIIVLIRVHTFAWPWLARLPEGKVRGEESSWHYAHVCSIGDQLAEIYQPHAQALFKAEKLLGSDAEQLPILMDLSYLPGVKTAIVCDLEGDCAQYPDDMYDLEQALPCFVEHKEGATYYSHPILRRKVGGLTRFHKFSQDGDSVDIMVRYGEVPGTENSILGLVLDTEWLLEQIPAFMDSVFREDQTLLFWSKTIPDLCEQALGITYHGDTLWWKGDRSLEMIFPTQLSGLIFDLKVHARYHWIRGENEYTKRMPGIRNYFILVEVLFIVLVILALFAIRTTNKPQPSGD